MDWQHYENNKSLKCLINMHLFYLLSLECYISHIPKHTQLSSRSGLDNMDPKRAFSNISTSITCVCQFYYIYIKRVREKSRECHNNKSQPFPDTTDKSNTHKSNKCTFALRLVLSSPSEVITLLKGLKTQEQNNTR